MPKLNILRHRAYLMQEGKCYYCGLPTWEKCPLPVAERMGLAPSHVGGLKCTAEHLKARSEGGKDTQKNIVVACLCCNSKRHQVRQPLHPKNYKQFVQKRMNRGDWHSATLMQRVRDTFQNPMSYTVEVTSGEASQDRSIWLQNADMLTRRVA